MTDRSSAQIKIGGTIATAEAMHDLLKALEEEGGVDWSNIEPVNGWRAHIEEAASKGRPILVQNHEVAGGQFPAIEEACRKHGLFFHRADDGHYAYSPRNAAFKPGLNPDNFECDGTIEGGPSIALSVLREWQAEGVLQSRLDWIAALFASLPPISLAIRD